MPPRAGPLAALGASAALVAIAISCRTPTSITFAFSTDVDCASAATPPLVTVVVSREANLEGTNDAPSSTKDCDVATAAGDLAAIGEVVAVPSGDETSSVTMRVVMGLGRSSEGCGIEPGLDGDPWSGCLVARRRLAFLPNEALTVAVPLHADCVGVPCDAVSTCVPGRGCVPSDIDPATCLGAGCDDEELAQQVASSAAATGGGGSSTTDAASSGVGGAGGAGDGGAGGDGGGVVTASAASSTASTGGDPCGNGAIDPGEDCDDANDTPGDYCNDCTLNPYCPPSCPAPEASCLESTCSDDTCVTVLQATCDDVPNGVCDACGRCCDAEGANCSTTRCPTGGRCTGSEQCTSGVCFMAPGSAEGVCCERVCEPDESCFAADTDLADGTCGPFVQ